MAVDQNDNNKNYLVQIMWTTSSVTLYELKGLSEDPNASSYVGNPHLASIIYTQNSDADNFPVKGYIVGGSKSIWSYN